MGNIALDIMGHVTIRANNEIIFEDKNQITANAKSVLAGCLSNLNGSKQIDNIIAVGTFGRVELPIQTVQHTVGDNQVTFKVEVGDGTFTGNIEHLILNSNTLGQFSIKTLGNIYQEEDVVLTIDWVITIL